MGIRKEVFGYMPDGREVVLFTIYNAKGEKACVTNYGAILVSLFVQDRAGSFRDVVLGYDKIEDYFDNHPMFGATVGRNVNRIRNARFQIDGKVYQLAKNRGEHNIHSDKKHGFHKVLWEYMIIDDNTVRFHYISPDGEQGFPGTLDVFAAYSLTQGGGLILTYRAVSDKKTLINMTNHTYFNLAGQGGKDILDTTVSICADHYTPVDQDLIPTGEYRNVLGTPMNLTEPVRIRDAMLPEYPQIQMAGGFDHNFVIRNAHTGLRKMAEAADQRSGIRMEVYSDLPGMQFYTGNSLLNVPGKRGTVYGKWGGFCMEPHYFPNSINTPGFEAPVFEPDEEYSATILYQFVPMKDTGDNNIFGGDIV